MTSKVRVGCSSSGRGSGDLITADELFEILIMILPEAEIIKNAFLKWISLPEELKLCMESHLENLTAPRAITPSSPKEINMYKGYSMSRILLKVFNEWSYIQDTLGAPGIQPGFTALPKRLELDITLMMKCMQEVLEYVIIRERSEHGRQFLSEVQRCKEIEKLEKVGKYSDCKPAVRSLSDTAMALSAGDHIYARMEITQALSAGKIPNQRDLDTNAAVTDCENDQESDDTGVQTTYDTEEDGFEQFNDEADLAKYLFNIGEDHLIQDANGEYTSSSENSEDDDEESSD
jgi:hypothetical protein